jgi:hypothetical protein
LNQSEFNQFLRYSQKDALGKSDSEKILSYIQWCNSRGIEEVIIRLSSEDKSWTGRNYFLDFTTSRLIASKKGFTRKFIDTGFIAGMAPFPYAVLAGEKIPDFKQGTILNTSEIIAKGKSDFDISYPEIEEMYVRRGIETTITNMLGTAISSNFLTVKARNGEQHSYRLPVGKNGSFEKMYYWLKVVVPVKVSVG